jgi:hypothetical protein
MVNRRQGGRRVWWSPLERLQQADVEDVVKSRPRRKLQFVGHWTDDRHDIIWPEEAGPELA